MGGPFGLAGWRTLDITFFILTNVACWFPYLFSTIPTHISLYTLKAYARPLKRVVCGAQLCIAAGTSLHRLPHCAFLQRAALPGDAGVLGGKFLLVRRARQREDAGGLLASAASPFAHARPRISPPLTDGRGGTVPWQHRRPLRGRPQT